MKKIFCFVLFLTLYVFADGSVETKLVPQTKDRLKKTKVQPIINIDKRNLFVSVPDAPNMAITIFLPSGRKIASKKINGETANIPLPKSVKGVVIVTIDANRNYYSQRVVVE